MVEEVQPGMVFLLHFITGRQTVGAEAYSMVLGDMPLSPILWTLKSTWTKNSLKLMRNDHGPIQETQPLSRSAEHLLSCLVAACNSVLSESSDSHIFSSATLILQTLKSGDPWQTSAAFYDNSIAAIAERCVLSDNSVSCAQLVHALNLMQFRIKIERFVIMFLVIISNLTTFYSIRKTNDYL